MAAGTVVAIKRRCSMASQKGTDYLEAARNAVTYVKSKLRFGPANNPLKLQSDVESQLRAMGALLRTRDGEDRDMDAKFVNPADSLRVAQVWAENAERYGGGNCGEHAATALIFLRRKGIFPLDWVEFSDKDHSFVIIGRSGSGGYKADEVPKQPWFPDAVICDPYWRRADYWSTVVTEYQPRSIRSLYHQEDQGMAVWKNQ
jgi:hypothetical protein